MDANTLSIRWWHVAHRSSGSARLGGWIGALLVLPFALYVGVMGASFAGAWAEYLLGGWSIWPAVGFGFLAGSVLVTLLGFLAGVVATQLVTRLLRDAPGSSSGARRVAVWILFAALVPWWIFVGSRDIEVVNRIAVGVGLTVIAVLVTSLVVTVLTSKRSSDRRL
jgi:hypothetical protein